VQGKLDSSPTSRRVRRALLGAAVATAAAAASLACGIVAGLGPTPGPRVDASPDSAGDVDVATLDSSNVADTSEFGPDSEPDADHRDAVLPDACVPDPLCSDAATSVCMPDAATVTCAMDANGCLVHTAPAACPPGTACSNGRCALPLSGPAASTLKLWFTADRGLDCDAAGLATRWEDQSGRGDDAVPFNNATLADGGTIGVHTGPFCHAPGHAINGIDVPYFSAPYDGPPYVNGTFDVDLSFLGNSQFTIFIVERRWATVFRAANANVLSMFGTLMTPTEVQPDPNHMISLGYSNWATYSDGGPCLQLAEDLAFFGVSNVAAPSDPGVPAPLSIDTFALGPAAGVVTYVNGVAQGSAGGAFEPLSGPGLALGSIGRGARLNTADNRFDGDIAEVVVFATELGLDDRRTIEQYLEAHWGPVTPLGSGGTCQ
jgi:hypothetical protein